MTETIPYNIIKKIEQIEIRQYPEVVLAVAENNTNDSAFGLLFQYISGNNTKKSKIAMTAPVITSEKINMTTPVITKNNYMAFPIPSSYSKNTVPTPTNPAVRIESQPKKQMAVLRFSGRASDASVQKYIKELTTILNTYKILMNGDPVLMRYNSPFTPGFLRRNEVAIEINDVDK